MAKFCTVCGKELKDGKECDCKKNVKEVSTSNSSIVTDVLNLIKGMFTAPVDTMKEFISEDNFNNGLIAIGLGAISVAILICVLCKELFATLIVSFSSLLGGTSSLGAASMGSLMGQIEIPYLKIAIVTIVTVIALYAAIAGLAYLISAKIFKSETSYKKMLVWLGTSAAFMTVLCLVTAICVLINIKLALVVYCMGSMLSTYYMYSGLSFACDTDENKLGYILMPSVLIASYVVVFIMTKILV